jgi:putative phosphoesterase
MKFAVIGDIHSNIYALENVLKDIENYKVDFIVSTGDLVGYLPFPNEVIQLIREDKILAIQGNHDRHIASFQKITDAEIDSMSDEMIQSSASAIFTSWRITDENRNYLKNLPDKITFSCNGFKILVVHGSPRKIDEYLYEEKEIISEIAETVAEDVIICGHTHIPYFTKIDNKYFINAGSVGKPKHGSAKSTYALVEIANEKVSSEIIEVDYDVQKIVTAINENRMISKKLIAMLEQGI